MELTTVRQAATDIGVHEATIWRWLQAGLLMRYKSKPGAPRATFVDLAQVRAIREQPPVNPVRMDQGKS